MSCKRVAYIWGKKKSIGNLPQFFVLHIPMLFQIVHLNKLFNLLFIYCTQIKNITTMLTKANNTNVKYNTFIGKSSFLNSSLANECISTLYFSIFQVNVPILQLCITCYYLDE